MLARQLRNNSTKSEIILWQQLKNNQLGYKFIRQKPLNNYIVDFFCYDLMLAIEIDGYSHNITEVYEKDKIKEETLKKYGIKILRIDDKDVFNDLQNTILAIQNLILQIEEHTPNPSQEGNLDSAKNNKHF